MKARYYDHNIGRFLSNDPVGFYGSKPMMFNRYAYAYNNPLAFVDPDGKEGTKIWTTGNSVVLIVPYAIDSSLGAPGFTSQQLNSEIDAKLSGSYNTPDGTPVDVKAVGVEFSISSTTVQNGEANVITVDPNVATANAQLGGNRSSIKPTSSVAVAVHELGHNLGAVDRYTEVTPAPNRRTQPSPDHANTLMGDLGGPTNSTQMNEILSHPANNSACAPGVNAATGGC